MLFRKIPPTATYPYGEHRSQVADLYLPEGGGLWPVVVLVHGGFWRSTYDRSLMVPLAHDLTNKGFAAWNIEYRRVGEKGGGWPGTFDDAAAAVDLLAAITHEALDLDRVVSVGHSAGGHLALWLGARHRLPAGAPGAAPTVKLTAAVSQAGVVDLRAATRGGMGVQPTVELMGAWPNDQPERYALASPIELLPMGIPQLLIHGRADQIVPVEHSVNYADAARAAGDPVELVAQPRVGHFDVIDPKHISWKAVTDRLGDLVNPVDPFTSRS